MKIKFDYDGFIRFDTEDRYKYIDVEEYELENDEMPENGIANLKPKVIQR